MKNIVCWKCRRRRPTKYLKQRPAQAALRYMCENRESCERSYMINLRSDVRRIKGCYSWRVTLYVNFPGWVD